MLLNFLFFGFYFLTITIVHVTHVFLTDPIITTSTYLFASYTLCQSMLETLLLIFIGYLIEQRMPRFVFFYIFMVLGLLLTHLIDFPLERLMDLRFWQALHLILQTSYANFIEMLISTNISLKIWALAFAGFALFILLGIAFYRLTSKRCISWSKQSAVLVAIGCLCSLISIDYSLNHTLPIASLFRMHKTLPWKTTLFFAPHPHLALPATLKALCSQEERIRHLDSQAFSLIHQPDIYIIILESLRHDFINEINTPHLAKFKQNNVSIPFTFSNANATHLSWFSLFHSQYPFYWEIPHHTTTHAGSLPLQLLKTMGYQIHAFASSSLSYYHMDDIIFGNDQKLANSLFIPDETCTELYLKDEAAMDAMISHMQSPGSGRVFLLFLDSSHFDYSFPKSCEQFTPCGDGANYFTALLSKKAPVELVNRYQNALLFLDSQLGKFFTALESTEQGRQSVVVITGDHGEEFYEKGNLFHASMLSKEQITPPIYYKFGNRTQLKQKISCQTTSHIDIFPSIFHYLTGSDVTASVFDGQSIFNQERWPFTVIARFNASNTPIQYCLHGPLLKLIVEFDQSDIFQSKQLHFLSTKTFEDETIQLPSSSLEEVFGPAFERLFPAHD